jgi:hypothetical protein
VFRRINRLLCRDRRARKGLLAHRLSDRAARLRPAHARRA